MCSLLDTTKNSAFAASRRHSILIVDDEAANIAVLNRILSDDYTLHSARSGEQGLQMAAELLPDLILLDVIMPADDGFKTLEKLRASSGSVAKIPVIFITALTSPEDEEKGFALGAVDYIYKPFKQIVVKARIATHLRAAGQMGMMEDTLSIASSLVADSPNLAMFFNENGVIEYANSATEIVTGYSLETFYQSGLAPILGDKEWRSFRDEYLQSARTMRFLKFQLPIYRKDKSQRWLSVTTMFLTLRDGRSGVGLVASDDTDAEILYRDLVTTKDQLQKALATSEEYNRRKNALFMRISQEVRSPLNAIIGTTDAAQNSDPEARGVLLDRITSNAYKLLHVIDEMLDVVQLSLNTLSLVPLPCDLYSLLDLVRENISTRSLATGLTFSSSVDKSVPRYIIVDEKRLAQTLHIFLDNAMRYTLTGGKISLSVDTSEPEGSMHVLKFAIADNGPGIPPEIQLSKCEAFESMLNEHVGNLGAGIGLGITIAKGIIQQLGGELNIDSSGDGTTVKFSITADICSPINVNETLENDWSILNGKRILLVDDLEVNREVAMIILGANGAVVDEVDSGRQALAQFAHGGTYDLILMDLHLPDLDGYETVRLIRSSRVPNAPVVPIVAISADVGGEITKRCFDAGMDAHLAKPINRLELLRTLSRLLRKK